MLWYKGWLETRLKLLVCVIFAVLFLGTLHAHPSPSVKAFRAGVSMFDSVLVLSCVLLAGAGIITQSAFQNMKGIYGSTLFTLSLPITRLRLLTVRAALGWVEMTASIGIFACGLWIALPMLWGIATPTDMLEYCATLIAGASVFYFFCVVLATFLEDQWRVFGGMLGFLAFQWISGQIKLPVFANIFLAMGKGSPLLTHSMPWSTIGFSVGLSILLFLVALKIVRVREY